MKKTIARCLCLTALYCVNLQATQLYVCDNCTQTKLNALIEIHVEATHSLETSGSEISGAEKNAYESLVVLDREKATATEFRLRYAEDSPATASAPYVVEINSDKPHLLEAASALAELKAINLQLAKQAKQGIKLPPDTGFITVADALRETADFEGVLATDLSSADLSRLNERVTRLSHQVQRLGNALGFSYRNVATILGLLTQERSWVVSLSDSSQILVDIRLKAFDDQLRLAFKAIPELARDNLGKRVPLSEIASDGYGFGGSLAQAQSYAELMRGMGIEGSVPNKHGKIYCTVTKQAGARPDKTSYGFACN
ncbi:hypothetical protein [Shewanella aegiceratis]|uniref:hypothetical protein n=1 Tax=Shewanella aegiceratis TaxID=2864203 RepID=UPI001C65B602|nr:hypothetical protein [Shewanella aegiceratis]QYJ83120.1 hypothetical protein K0H80_03580 [Shewanella aegiceratis]